MKIISSQIKQDNYYRPCFIFNSVRYVCVQEHLCSIKSIRHSHNSWKTLINSKITDWTWMKLDNTHSYIYNIFVEKERDQKIYSSCKADVSKSQVAPNHVCQEIVAFFQHKYPTVYRAIDCFCNQDNNINQYTIASNLITIVNQFN